MIKKCLGCGSLLQSSYINEEGYVDEKHMDHSILCERCFRIRHYGDYQVISKQNSDFYPLLEHINESQDLVVLVVDLFQIPKDLEVLSRLLTNDVLLVLTKRDLFSYDIYDEKFMQYMKRYSFHYVDSLIISSEKNYHFDLLIDFIHKYQKSSRVYVVGYTNAGKSTMINQLIKNYTSLDPIITTSNLPSTTLQSIFIDIDDHLTIVDTPGILEENSMITLADGHMLKRIVPKKTIKPRTYQIKIPQSLVIPGLLVVSVALIGSVTVFLNNDLKIDRYYKDVCCDDLVGHELDVLDGQDVVIAGLGFLKFKGANQVVVYTLTQVDVYVRDSLI